MTTAVRDVWVKERERNAPAHRIPHNAIPADLSSTQAFRIACPPGMAFGGEAITRQQARDLRLHPCVRCFAVKQVVYPPPPRPCDYECAELGVSPDCGIHW